jgi:phosphotransferase system enzyme I (PtsI)
VDRAGQVDAELERLQHAVDVTRDELRRIRDGMATELGEEEARIYDTHLLILDDPELWKAVDTGVRTDLRSAAAVFHAYLQGVAARLDQVGDEVLRERRADVVDVERRVLRNLFGDSGRSRAAVKEPVDHRRARSRAERGRDARPAQRARLRHRSGGAHVTQRDRRARAAAFPPS